jgi:hypothetical protein
MTEIISLSSESIKPTKEDLEGNITFRIDSTGKVEYKINDADLWTFLVHTNTLFNHLD